MQGPFPALPTDVVDDLGHAMALADLLARDTIPGPRPPRPADGLDEVATLRAAVRQLEHALSSRVVVEQAIGVLTERWRVAPRDAFEQLRRVTRSRGVRIHDLAKLVIESSTDPDVPLPPELVPPGRRPPEPRQSLDPRGRRDLDGGERRDRRSRRDRSDPPVPPPDEGPRGMPARVPPVPARAPAPRAPHGRHASIER